MREQIATSERQVVFLLVVQHSLAGKRELSCCPGRRSHGSGHSAGRGWTKGLGPKGTVSNCLSTRSALQNDVLMQDYMGSHCGVWLSCIWICAPKGPAASALKARSAARPCVCAGHAHGCQVPRST